MRYRWERTKGSKSGSWKGKVQMVRGESAVDSPRLSILQRFKKLNCRYSSKIGCNPLPRQIVEEGEVTSVVVRQLRQSQSQDKLLSLTTLSLHLLLLSLLKIHLLRQYLNNRSFDEHDLEGTAPQIDFLLPINQFNSLVTLDLLEGALLGTVTVSEEENGSLRTLRLDQDPVLIHSLSVDLHLNLSTSTSLNSRRLPRRLGTVRSFVVTSMEKPQQLLPLRTR
jgi:hypothetical protein